MKYALGLLGLVALSAACSDDDDGSSPRDAGRVDALVSPDAAAADAAMRRDADVQQPDAGMAPDARADAGPLPDAGVDAGLDSGLDGDASSISDGGGDAGCSAPKLSRPPVGYSGPAPTAYFTFDEAQVAGDTIISGAGTSSVVLANAAAETGLGTDGQVEDAAAFDGAAALISGDVEKSSLFTVSAWIRVARYPTPIRTVAVNLGNGPSAWEGWGIAVRPSGTIAAFVEGGGDVQNEHIAGTLACVPPNEWVHIAVTMDGTEVRMYRDGLFQEATPVNLPDINFGAEGLVLGYHSFFQNAYFEGELDELAIWNEVLSVAELEEVYLAGRDGVHFVCPTNCAARSAPAGPPTATGLVTWLRADRGLASGPEGSVCTWCDFSGSGNAFAQSDAALQPTRTASAAGGLPALSFVGDDDLRRDDALGIPNTAGRTYIAVWELLSVSDRTTVILQGVRGTAGTYLMMEANTFRASGTAGRFGAYVTNNAYDLTLATDSDAHIHVMQMETMTRGEPVLNELSYWIDGASQTLTRTTGGLGNGNIEAFPVEQSAVGGVFTARPNGDRRLSEVLIYDRPITPEERRLKNAKTSRTT